MMAMSNRCRVKVEELKLMMIIGNKTGLQQEFTGQINFGRMARYHGVLYNRSYQQTFAK